MLYGQDTLTIINTLPATQDANGDYDDAQEEIVMQVQCDAMPVSGEARVYTLPDGTATTYSYVCFLPVDVPELKHGDKVCLTRKDAAQQEFTVKGFQRYAFQAKVWL